MTPELITLSNGSTQGDSWWRSYLSALEQGGLTPTAREVVDLDAELIVGQGVFGAGHPGEVAWPSHRVRKGLVVGSVQSGKTASMLAVAAKSLDRGIDAVVLLTGTRTALWRQTAQRTLEQLDGWTPDLDGQRARQRVMIPKPRYLLGRGGPPELADLYYENPQMVARSISRGRPLIAIAMKNGDHLTRLRECVQSSLERLLARSPRPVHMLVIDDEADDGSILDAVVEASLGPESEALKMIPRHIRRLWSGPGDLHEAWSPHLHATYLAYTATPQANLLQAEHNPLTPTDFVFSLRVPQAVGNVRPPRAPSFEEPEGVSKYYTGGDLFYQSEITSDGPLAIKVVPPTEQAEESTAQFVGRASRAQAEVLGDALRAYLVASALRLSQSGKSLTKHLALTGVGATELSKTAPNPMSMLIHPSASMQAHFEVAEIIATWCGSTHMDSYEPGEFERDESGRPAVDPASLSRRLGAEDSEWKRWFEEYSQTWERVHNSYPGFSAVPMPEWDAVKQTLREEIFPNLKIRVINSSPDADDRPIFRPSEGAEGAEPAADLLSIFVSGSVMSRGVTIEGLLTTLFVRYSGQPRADTQMQMQRWLGYRGAHLHLCRVFLYEDQFELFEAYHENDQALRGEILAKMNAGEATGGLTVLQGSRYLATGKIVNLRALPLCPGPFPFITLTGSNQDRRRNASLLARLFSDNPSSLVTVSGTDRGILLDNMLSADEAAKLLDDLQFEGHHPDPDHPTHRRWHSIARSAGISELLFRPPQPAAGEGRVRPRACPYSIAAYLRLWRLAVTHPPRSIVPTDRSTPWHLIDQVEHARSVPDFSIGIRFGRAGPSSHPELDNLGVQAMTRQIDGDILTSTWGTRNPGEGEDRYFGDQFFDYHRANLTPPVPEADGPVWRARGAPGLILFHVIQDRGCDVVTAGIAVPLGGPDHFAALAPRS